MAERCRYFPKNMQGLGAENQQLMCKLLYPVLAKEDEEGSVVSATSRDNCPLIRNGMANNDCRSEYPNSVASSVRTAPHVEPVRTYISLRVG